MIFIKYDGAGNITAKNFMPFDEVYGLGKTKEQLQLEGILVDSLPEAEERVGMDATLKINLTTKEFYHEYHERMLTPVEMVSELQEENAKLRVDLENGLMELTMLVAMGGM